MSRVALERAVQRFGCQSSLAAAVGVTQQCVSFWLTKSKHGRLPAEHVQTVSAATGIPPHELRPDIFPAPTHAPGSEAA